MRAKQATRAGTALRTRLPPLDCTSEGQEFLRGGGGWISILRIGATTGGG